MPGDDTEYPAHEIKPVRFEDVFDQEYARPVGLDEWPPVQVRYLRLYLDALGCKSAIVESHYIDRDYIQDLAAFYSRSLRSYRNYCRRIHFFSIEVDEARWRKLIGDSREPAQAEVSRGVLQDTYLGYSVVRPLPGAPVGRTVLRTFPPQDDSGHERRFPAVRKYRAHLGPFRLTVKGLAFQQQDRGVSACATTALWSALHCVARLEALGLPTPAEITEAASRYLLADGRPLPSEGLSVHQICEAIRASRLSPVVVRPRAPEVDVGQLHGYIASGFPVVLGIRPISKDGEQAEGHAVCVVGIKEGALVPNTDPELHRSDASTQTKALYIHDDRLGPYATAELVPYTMQQDGGVALRTAVSIRWPDKAEAEYSVVEVMIVPVPVKVRLSVTRLRELAHGVAELVGATLPEAAGHAVFSCRFEDSSVYRTRCLGYGLSDGGTVELSCGIAMSRYVGVVEIRAQSGAPLLDIVVDATETNPSVAILAWVRREGFTSTVILEALAKLLGGRAIS